MMIDMLRTSPRYEPMRVNQWDECDNLSINIYFKKKEE